MPGHQTRRSISVSRKTYDALRDYCAKNNASLSGFCEVRICEALGIEPARTFRKTSIRPLGTMNIKPEDPAPVQAAPDPSPVAVESAPEPEVEEEALPEAAVSMSAAERRAMVLAKADYRLRVTGRDHVPDPAAKRVNKAKKPSIVDKMGRRPKLVSR